MSGRVHSQAAQSQSIPSTAKPMRTFNHVVVKVEDDKILELVERIRKLSVQTILYELQANERTLGNAWKVLMHGRRQLAAPPRLVQPAERLLSRWWSGVLGMRALTLHISLLVVPPEGPCSPHPSPPRSPMSYRPSWLSKGPPAPAAIAMRWQRLQGRRPQVAIHHCCLRVYPSNHGVRQPPHKAYALQRPMSLKAAKASHRAVDALLWIVHHLLYRRLGRNRL